MKNQKQNQSPVNPHSQPQSQNIVRLSFGAGNDPRAIQYHEGDSVQSILERAGLQLKPGQCVTLGRKRINPKKLEKTLVQPGDTLVIAGMPANG